MLKLIKNGYPNAFLTSFINEREGNHLKVIIKKMNEKKMNEKKMN
jgi:hypothetical protein